MPDDLINLIVRVVSEPWPTTAAEHRPWAARLGLPTEGNPIPAPDESASGTQSLHADSDGRHVFWVLDQGRLVHLDIIISTLQQAEFDEIRAAALALREAFDARWPASDSYDGNPGFTATWETSRLEVELYWHAPQSRGLQSETAIQLAVSPRG